MAKLLDLPPELLVWIVKDLLLNPTELLVVSQVTSRWAVMSPSMSLSATCRTFHALVCPLAYEHAAKYFPALLCWASDRGHARLVKEVRTVMFEMNTTSTTKVHGHCS